MRILSGAVLCACLALCGRCLAAAPPANTNASPVAVWDLLARVAVGAGYRENILLSSVASENSAFFSSAADISLIRLSETGSQLGLFLLADDRRYFDSPSVDKEQLFSGSVFMTLPTHTGHEFGGDVQYLYQHQVLDVSETEAASRRLLVDGHAVWVHPTWKYTLGPDWTLQLEGTALRQIYAGQDLDDYWEGAGRLALAHSYGWKSELSLGYRVGVELPDTRPQAGLDGVAITNSSVSFLRQEIGSQWRHFWDRGRHWRTTTKASYMFRQDNGSGYYDYDRVVCAQQIRWANSGWDLKANARFGWYFYRHQRIEAELRQRAYYAFDLRAERRIAKHWFLYAAAEYEWDLSNDPLDTFHDWAASGGIGAEF